MNYSVRLLSRLLMIVLMVLGFACRDETEKRASDSASDYYPLMKGVFQTYDVSETRYTLGVPNAVTYAVKTLVVDSFSTVNNQWTYVIYRYRRNTAADPWSYLDTWSARAGNREVVVSESNTQYVKVKGPVSNGITWNGNTYNNSGEDDYVMKDVRQQQSVGGVTFDDCVSIEQSNNEDYVVFLDQRYEIYARGVGLISREVKQLSYCTQPPSCLAQQIVDEGVVYSQTMTSYGRE